MERKIFSPKGAICDKCREPLAFYKTPRGRWCPCNPDGSDHFDLCREMAIKKGIRKPGIDFMDFPLKQHGRWPVITVESPGPPFIVDP